MRKILLPIIFAIGISMSWGDEVYADPLLGSWQLSEVMGKEVDTSNIYLYIKFKSDYTVVGHDGCNSSYSGRYSDNMLFIMRPNPYRTMIGCDVVWCDCTKAEKKKRKAEAEKKRRLRADYRYGIGSAIKYKLLEDKVELYDVEGLKVLSFKKSPAVD